MASCGILLFLQIKNTFSKGQQFEDVEMIKFNLTQQLLDSHSVLWGVCPVVEEVLEEVYLSRRGLHQRW